ncbi:hypothetical protein LUCX_252 [Xanthomonas phage vB_XciM_LucasX]|nr:hypothetical protein LUCX_252 [Xanthomonas phage vB_XciM_LucasX]
MSEALYKRPYLIQRMQARSKNNQVRLGERYSNEYMGASEFERGTMAQTLKSMHGFVDHGQFQVGELTIYAAWDHRNYNSAGVQLVLDGLWNGQFRTKEWLNFSLKKYVEQQRAVKEMRLSPMARSADYTDAWFDIDHGLFWTWQKINLKDIVLNIAKSHAWMSLSEGERRAAQFETHGRATLQGALGPIADQLRNRG